MYSHLNPFTCISNYIPCPIVFYWFYLIVLFVFLLLYLQIDNIKKSYESLTVCSCNSSTVINGETITGSNLCSTNNSCHHFLSRVECKPQICSFLETDCGNRRFSLLLNAAYTTNTTTTKQDDKYLFNVVRTINRGYGLKTLTSFQQVSTNVNDNIFAYKAEFYGLIGITGWVRFNSFGIMIIIVDCYCHTWSLSPTEKPTLELLTNWEINLLKVPNDQVKLLAGHRLD